MSESLAHLELNFESNELLLGWYAELVAVGSVPLSAPERLEGRSQVRLTVRVQDGAPIELIGTRIEGASEEEPARLAVVPTLALREQVYALAMARHGGRITSGANGLRRYARFATLLKVRFRSMPALFDEFITNISEGGLFVRTDSPPPLDTEIELAVGFPDGSERMVCGRVVRVVTPEEAAAQRAQPGVGIRFLEANEAFTAATGQLLESYLRRPRRVLVVDDDAFFLQVLSDGLLNAGFEVATARGGREAARKLVDLLYDLDAVVLDVHMPGLDGTTLLHRIRRLGAEMPLRVVLVSGLDPALLAPMLGPDGADAALSKALEMPELIAELRRALD